MNTNTDNIKRYGIIAGVATLVLQHAVYLLAHFISIHTGIEPFSPKLAIDDLIPIVPIFIIPYIWSYAYWAMAPMAVSKCEKSHYQRYMSAYILAMLVGGVILVFAPTYMDRVAEGLKDPDIPGFGAHLMQFWYSLDGGDMAYNLLPSFHCLNSTMAYLGVAGRKEIPTWYRVYSLVITLLIYAATVFVKQHFILDVFSGIAVALLCWFVAGKLNLGRFFKWTTPER